jgi:hypothetical protein
MNFKEYYLLREAKVLTPSSRKDPSRPDKRKYLYPEDQEPLKDSDIIRVYHGFNNVDDLFYTLEMGLSGKDRAKRIYSYETNNNPRGLFVTISLDVAKDFGNYIIELHSPVRELEAPLWPGGSYTVQGQMAQYFSSEEDREETRLKRREDAKNAKEASIRNSDRPELAELLFSGEQQALFTGDLNNNSIRAIWVNTTPERSGRFSNYKRMSAKQFLKEYSHLKEKKRNYYDRNYNRFFSPREKFDPETFFSRVEKEYNTDKFKISRENILNDFSDLNENQLLKYFWPNQIKDAIKFFSRK